MQIADHLAALRREGELLAGTAAGCDPDLPVPTCPGWRLRDLLRHTGGVHRWATGHVRDRRTRLWDVDLDEVVGAWPPDGELVGWFRDGHRALVETLEAADPDLECYMFLAAPSALAFWARRQAHETAIHRVDAQRATGRVNPHPAPFAADGIDELLLGFYGRRSRRLRADPPRTLAVRTTDTAEQWLARIGPDGPTTSRVAADSTDSADSADSAGGAGGADCVVSGPAAELYLLLWNRREPHGLPVAGDAGVLDLWRDRANVR